MFNEGRSIESFNAYQCLRSYLFDMSMQELIELAKEYGIEISKAIDVNTKSWRLTLHAVDKIPSQNDL